MKKHFTEAQIREVLRQANADDVVIRELCKTHGVTEQTFFRWRKKYHAPPVPDDERPHREPANRTAVGSTAQVAGQQESVVPRRVPLSERRARILDTAFHFFSEHGLDGDTRALAKACGVSQRLLYRAFPNKAALLDALYESHVIGPVKSIWPETLRDRSRPVEERLVSFCLDYYETILTSRWLRTVLFASLAETNMASAYISGLFGRLINITVEEVAYELGLEVPEDTAVVHEIGMILHGAVSHHAIRRHVYRTDTGLPIEAVLTLQVRCFLSGVKAILPEKPH